jgi:hypothetical protein
LGNQLEFVLAQEHKNKLNVISDVRDEARKTQLRTEDEVEDFLDEGNRGFLRYCCYTKSLGKVFR